MLPVHAAFAMPLCMHMLDERMQRFAESFDTTPTVWDSLYFQELIAGTTPFEIPAVK